MKIDTHVHTVYGSFSEKYCSHRTGGLEVLDSAVEKGLDAVVLMDKFLPLESYDYVSSQNDSGLKVFLGQEVMCPECHVGVIPRSLDFIPFEPTSSVDEVLSSDQELVFILFHPLFVWDFAEERADPIGFDGVELYNAQVPAVFSSRNIMRTYETFKGFRGFSNPFFGLTAGSDNHDSKLSGLHTVFPEISSQQELFEAVKQGKFYPVSKTIPFYRTQQNVSMIADYFSVKFK
ncbi:MAG: hypothetical protein GOU97_02345 [Nanoarchaeota archaeon]|nr:hypothetical protein [Nanoarchaeota archaeon]